MDGFARSAPIRNQLRAKEERGESTPAAEVRGLTRGADGRLRRRGRGGTGEEDGRGGFSGVLKQVSKILGLSVSTWPFIRRWMYGIYCYSVATKFYFFHIVQATNLRVKILVTPHLSCQL